MSQQPRIVAFAGSAREGSLNKKLIRAAARLATEAGAQVTLIDLRDFPLPLFDGDVETESGLPENIARLKEIFADQDGFLIASPEYNSSITPLLKNTIDWASRSVGAAPGLAWARAKPVALISASPGALGGLRALVHVRAILQNIGMMVIPRQKAVGGAASAFDDDGNLVDDSVRQALAGIVEQLVDVARRLRTAD